MRGQGRIYRRGGTWWLDYGVRGQRHREKTGMTSKREALDLLRERVGDRKAGKLAGSPDKVTLHELREGLERHYQREDNRSWPRARQAFDHLEAVLHADTPALTITKQRLGQYLDHRLKEGAARATVRYEIAVLNAAYSVAVEDELLVMRPMFKLPSVENRRLGFFEPGDFAALLLELPVYLRPLIQFLRFTGWRRSEALGLRWDAVDWEGQAVRLAGTETKSGKARSFPFGQAPELKELLEAQWKVRDGLFVFHRRGACIGIGALRSGWKRATKRAGLAGRLVHDLRRTAARDFRRAGVDEGTIMAVCGWETRDMFDRYNIIDAADRASAVGKRFNGTVTAQKGAPTTSPSLLSSSATTSAA